ncbi:MAG: metallophosphoesterase, partial [Thermoplasmata archaeon]|nr:metallophosphoesterase [Thermoplasmata archaeon]
MKKIIIPLLAISFLIPPNHSLKNVNISIEPYTQNVSNDSITIVWETDVATSINYVEYWNDEQKYVAYDNTTSIHHEITISPSFSSGYYRVSSDGVKSKEYRFKLARYCYETGKFRCIIYGDSRGKWDNWKHAKEVASAINMEKPDIVIHCGDLVEDGRETEQWDEWLDFMMPLMQNATLFTALGNHERNASRYYEIFALPNNEMWYSFYYGPCHFIILDNYAPWDETSSQYKWLERELAKPATFKIVCFHEPIYCSGGHSPRKDIRKVWEPLFIKYDVDIVFQSHNHYYQRTNPIDGIIYVVSGGGGAPLYDPGFAPYINKSVKAYHYCILDVNLSNMEMNFYAKDVDGNIIDNLVFTWGLCHTAPYVKQYGEC